MMRKTIGFIILAAMSASAVAPWPATAQTVERVRDSGVVRIGHRHDARPFSYVAADGAPAGYSIDLCERIVDAIGQEVGRAVVPEYVELSTEERFQAVADGRVDLLCGADTVTLGRREIVSFTVPVFLTGIGAALSADAPGYLKEVIAGQASQVPPRAAILQAIRQKTFGVRSGTTAETWLKEYVGRFGGTAEVITVADHADGIEGVASGAFDVYFADRALLLGQLQVVQNPDQIVVSDRLFTFEPYAIALPRGDEELRLLADRTISHFFASPDFMPFYRDYFGTPDELQRLGLMIGTVPD